MSNSKIILSINAGSSSVKVSVYSSQNSNSDPHELAVVQVDGLTAPPPTLKYECGDHKIKGEEINDVKNQEDAFRFILEQLEKDEGLPGLKNRNDIGFACHRVVHGGDYKGPKVVDGEAFKHIEELSDLAPLHNSASLTIVRAVTKELPNALNIAFFDSAFHATIPPHISTYPIDPKIAKHNKLRKYGFHGTSYAFILHAVATHLQQTPSTTNLIALHLGSGASVCCIKNGQSHDTSMGLTPLAGLPGATRSGSVDPSLIFHFTHDAGRLAPGETKDMHITQAEEILNKRSGWKVLTGTTDFGEILRRAGKGDAECRLAVDLFVDRVLGFVASYFVKLEGKVDALVFAGGIGEKGVEVRKRVVEGVRCLGFEIDEKRNSEVGNGGVVEEIGHQGAGGVGRKVLVVKTDEQLEMARGCVREFIEMEK